MNRQTIINMGVVVLDAMLLRFGSRAGARLAVCGMGKYRREGRLELLHRHTEYVAAGNRLDAAVRKVIGAGFSPLIVAYGFSRPNASEVRRYVSALERAGTPCSGLLHLRRVQGILLADGWLREDDQFFTVDILSLPGSGMWKLSVGRLWPLRSVTKGQGSSEQRADEVSLSEKEGPDRSRLEAFLGEGDIARGREILRRAAELRVAVVGCGRMGFKLVIELVKSGVARTGGLYLSDGDLVMKENLDVMILPVSSVGKPKSEEMAKLVLALDPGYRVFPIVGTISDRIAAEAAMSSDIIITCADNDAAVFGSEVLARRCNRVHFALSGGAAYTQSGAAAAGGEIRLSISGCRGCAICFGNIDSVRAVRDLSRDAGEERSERMNSDPLGERPGSCGAVLSSVTGGAMHLFWRLLQGKQRRSVWLHYDANGEVPAWRNWTSRARRSCRFCSENGLGGRGDWDINND